MKLRFKTGELVYDDYKKADIIARLEMWLIDDEYMAKIDVHDLLRDALREIETLSKKNEKLRTDALKERSLADALAFTTSGLVAFVSDDVIDSLGDFGDKVKVVLDAWTFARRDSESS